MNRHALDVKLTEEGSQRQRCLVMFPAHVLPRLTSFLGLISESLPLWGKNHRLVLTVRNKYSASPARVERMLLEPWRSLRSLREVCVNDKLVSAAYADSLRVSMASSGFSPQDWLRTVTAHKESGAKLLMEGKLHDSLATSSIVGTLMVNTFQQATECNVLRSMPWVFHQVINRLRFQAELNNTLAILRLQLPAQHNEIWSMGLQSANIAADIAEDKAAWIWRYQSKPALWTPDNDANWYTGVERAKTRFRRGNIMMALGEWGYACNDLEIAQSLSPGDAAIESALKEARQRYDPEVRLGTMLKRYGIRFQNN